MNRSRSHKYRMKFLRPDQDLPADGPTRDPRHVPIEILVHAFNGEKYTLFTENDNETISDVKRCLLANANLDYLSILREIELISLDVKGYEDDNKEVSNLLTPLPMRRIVELRLLKIDPVWTSYEQELIDEIKRKYENGEESENTVRVKDDHRLDVFRWILKNKSNMTTLVAYDIHNVDMFDMIIDAIKNPNILLEDLVVKISNFDMTKFSSALIDNTSIKKLALENPFSCDEMQVFFDMISRNVGLTRISIHGSEYRMKDLVNSLQNNTIRRLRIPKSKVVATEEDIVNLIDVLGKHTLTNFFLYGINSSNDPFDLVRLNQLIRQRKGEWLDHEFKVDGLDTLIGNSRIEIEFLDSGREIVFRCPPRVPWVTIFN
jgi:hypothetical protein